MSTFNRRAILAGAATAIAVVQPGAVRIANAKPIALSVGAGPAVGPDPIFAAIAAYIEADEAHGKAARL